MIYLLASLAFLSSKTPSARLAFNTEKTSNSISVDRRSVYSDRLVRVEAKGLLYHFRNSNQYINFKAIKKL